MSVLIVVCDFQLFYLCFLEDDMEIDPELKVKMLNEFYDKTEKPKWSLKGCK